MVPCSNTARSRSASTVANPVHRKAKTYFGRGCSRNRLHSLSTAFDMVGPLSQHPHPRMSTGSRSATAAVIGGPGPDLGLLDVRADVDEPEYPKDKEDRQH